MKIAVLSGSPKGKDSVSLQSLYYISKKFPEHDYEVFHISQSIQKIESDNEQFEKIIETVRSADLVMWVTPVYSFLVPAQFKRFIELVYEKNVADAFHGKFAGIIMTSINFFDHCAVSYLRSTCDDMGMLFCGAFSADSYDLLNEEEREKLHKFGQLLFEKIADKTPLARAFYPVIHQKRDYQPALLADNLDLQGKKMIVVQDKDYKNTNLGKMIEGFRSLFKDPIELLTLSDLNIKGGCMGCVQCGFDHECLYDDKDDFIDFFNTIIKKADILVFAGEIKDRWLSSIWKQFYDRSFFNNHIPVLTGKQMGCLFSGPLTQLSNLREITESFIEWQRANLVDIVSDENDSDSGIDASIKQLAKGLLRASLTDYIKPATFLGKGGHKIFRDDVWGRHRFVFQVDHEYYEENGFYDFPQYDDSITETNKNMLELTKDPEMRKAVRKMLKTEMVKPHKKIVEQS